MRRLGEGGAGTVYQAVDLLLGRAVAAKRLHAEVAAGLLEHEGRALAVLAHPNVVAVYDVARIDGENYLIMEYVDGCDLEQRLAMQAPLHAQAVLRLFRQVARAVAAAHDQGILHCDLKPANVLISWAGDVKLTDFTLSRRLTPAGFQGPAGASRDAAPEQIAGKPLDARADVYGLGMLLRCLLNAADPVDPLIAEVQTVAGRATASDPRARYGTVRDLLAALPESGEATALAAPVSGPRRDLTRVASPRTTVQPRQWPRLRSLAGGAVGALLLGVMFMGLLARVHPDVFASPTRVTVPDLVATQSQSAQLVARSLALRPVVHAMFSATAARGTVLQQHPAPRSRVTPNTAVVLVVSRGPRPVAVPNLISLSQADAVHALAGVGLHASIRTEDTTAHPSGQVLDQVPAAGAQVLPRTRVTITVSHTPWWWIF